MSAWMIEDAVKTFDEPTLERLNERVPPYSRTRPGSRRPCTDNPGQCVAQVGPFFVG